MLKIRFIVVDRTRSPFLKEAESFYLERLRKFVRVEWVEVKATKIEKSRPPEEVLTAEGRTISRRLSPRDYLVILDRTGHQYDSEGLATWLDRISTSHNRWVCFAIGGPLGISRDILGRANSILSLSKLTFTHEMSRVFLLEQIYRAITITKGQNYHK